LNHFHVFSKYFCYVVRSILFSGMSAQIIHGGFQLIFGIIFNLTFKMKAGIFVSIDLVVLKKV